MRAPRKAVRRVIVMYERRLYVRMMLTAHALHDEAVKNELIGFIQQAETPVKPEDRN